MHGKAKRRRTNAAILCADTSALQATIDRYAGISESGNGVSETEQGDWAGWALAGLTDPPGDYEDGGGNGNGAPVDARAGALQRSAAVAAQLRGTVRVLTAQIADLTAQVALLQAELAVLHAQVDGEGAGWKNT